MLSKEKLLEAVDMQLAEMQANAVYEKLQVFMEQQRDGFIAELAANRKATEQLKAELQRSEAQRLQAEIGLREALQEIKVQRAINAKANQLLDEAVKDLGE